MPPAGYHPRTSTTPMRSCTLRAGTRKVRGFATGQGRGWPWSKTPSCRRLRPGGAYGKRSYEALTEQLNITSRCITRSRQGLRAREALPYLTTFLRGTTVDARSYTMKRYVMMRIPGTHAPTKLRRSPGVHPPLGDRGGQSGGHCRTLRGSDRNQAFFVLMSGTGLRGQPCAPEGPVPDSSAKRA